MTTLAALPSEHVSARSKQKDAHAHTFAILPSGLRPCHRESHRDVVIMLDLIMP